MSTNELGAGGGWIQPSFDTLGEPLCALTFVVVDLETTGGSPADSAITEIGAVKVRCGEVVGEFQTLVNPGTAMPPFVAVLTGITDTMLAPAPMLTEVLPAFLEFAVGAVLVAHNAPFDIGFLRAGCQVQGLDWPSFRVVDTAVLARRVLTRDETPNCKLSSLARYFRSGTEPCHRALADARATVDVLHGLLERVGNLGIQTLAELSSFTSQVSEAQRRKRHLAADVPSAPGVYVFRDARERPLYVGTSRDLRSRVRQYFMGSERRSRMAEMIGAAERVDTLLCAHGLEAEVRELRLIAVHKPPYNRRSKYPERVHWLTLTAEPYPRLSVVRVVREAGGTYLGPFSSRRSVEAALAAILDAVPIRQCSSKLSARRPSPACALAELGRCGAPCEHQESVTAYADHVETVRRAVHGDPAPIAEHLLARIEALATARRYEDAAHHRDRLAAFLRATVRTQRLAAFTAVPELVAARPDGAGGWEISVVRHGRLVAAGLARRGEPPMPQVEALLATAETVFPGAGPTPCASAEETERVLAWVERTETRTVQIEGVWASPADGAGRWRGLLEQVLIAPAAADPFADRRQLRTTSRPVRVSA
jgi:DNA polymerase-3 subunit epsilon